MPRHKPIRSCAICRVRREKRSLTRLVMTGAGLTRDPGGKRDGRGAYLCNDPLCWRRAAESNLLARALRQPLRERERQQLAQYAAELVTPE